MRRSAIAAIGMAHPRITNTPSMYVRVTGLTSGVEVLQCFARVIGGGRAHAAASAAAGSRREMTFEIPSAAIDTPYSESAASIVRF